MKEAQGVYSARLGTVWLNHAIKDTALVPLLCHPQDVSFLSLNLPLMVTIGLLEHHTTTFKAERRERAGKEPLFHSILFSEQNTFSRRPQELVLYLHGQNRSHVHPQTNHSQRGSGLSHVRESSAFPEYIAACLKKEQN